MKNINYKKAYVIIFFFFIGSIIGSKLSFKIDSNAIKKYFGIFLLCIAIFEIYSFYKQYILKKKVDNIKYKN